MRAFILQGSAKSGPISGSGSLAAARMGVHGPWQFVAEFEVAGGLGGFGCFLAGSMSAVSFAHFPVYLTFWIEASAKREPRSRQRSICRHVRVGVW